MKEKKPKQPDKYKPSQPDEGPPAMTQLVAPNIEREANQSSAQTMAAPAPKDAEVIEATKEDVPAEWEVGDVILDLYEVKQIHKGGMGLVYRIRHRGWNIYLAVKSPRKEKFKTEADVENFERECEAWVNLGVHPNIVCCYYVRRLGGIPRVFAEYVEGGSLKDWIEEKKLYEGGLEKALERMLDMAIQFAWGLHYAHEQGLVHKDVKPANVMMTPDGIPKVTDFGFGSIITPAFCSPEQANGEKLSRKTDIWNFGVSILEMFIGEVIWMVGQVADKVLESYLETGAEDKNIPRMPEALANILRSCFQREQADRPQNMLEVADVLQKIYEEISEGAYFRKKPDPIKLRADAQNNRAISLLDLGHEQKAERCWEEALEADRAHLAATFNFGYYQWRKARIDPYNYLGIQKGLEGTHGSNPDYWYNLATVEAEIGLIDKAKETARRAIELGYKEESVKDILGLSSSLIRVFEGHTDAVNSIALSSDGRYAISGSSDATLRICEIETGKCIKVFEGHTDAVNSIALSSDGRYAISGSSDRTLRLWEIETGKCVKMFWGHTRSVTSVALSLDGRYAISGSVDNTLRLWEIEIGKCVKVFEGHASGVISVALSPDGRYTVSGSTDNTLRLWEIETGKCIRVFKGHIGSVNSVALSPDGRYAISGSSDRTLRLWEIETGKCIRVFLGHTNAITSVAVNPNGRYAISGSLDRTLRLWEIETGKCIRMFEGYTWSVTSVAISPDGRYAISGGIGGRGGNDTLRLWKIDEIPELFQYIISIPSSSEDIQQREENIELFISGASYLIEAGDYGKAYLLLQGARKMPGCAREPRILDLINKCGLKLDLINKCGLKGGRRKGLHSSWCLRVFEGHTGSVTSVDISPDGRYAISGSSDRTLRLWEIETGKCIKVFEGHTGSGHTGSVTSVVICPDGKYAISGAYDGTLRLWEIETGKHIREFERPPDLLFKMRGDSVTSVAIITVIGISGLYAGYAVSASRSRCLRLWDVETGNCIGMFFGHTDAVNSVTISGRYAISGSVDNTLRLWKVWKDKCIRVFKGHTGSVNSVAINPDGRYAISGSTDNTLRLWKIKTGKCIRVFLGHTDAVTSVALSPDGIYAISGSYDNTLKLWEIETGKCIKVLLGHTGSVNSVALSPDGRYAISGSYDNTLRLWELDWDWEFPEEEIPQLHKLSIFSKVKALFKRSQELSLRIATTTALGEFGDTQAVQPLVEALRDEKEAVRQEAARALGRIGDSQAIQPLVAALLRGEDQLRWAAAEALGEIGDAQAVQPLIEALRDKNGDVRVAAAGALGKIEDAQAVQPLIEALKDESGDVRIAAAEALGKIGDAQSVEPLVVVLKDKDMGVRNAAALALGRIGDARAVEPLKTMLKDKGENRYVRESAAVALNKIKIS